MSIDVLPRLSIEVDGSELAGGIAEKIGHTVARQRLSLPAMCELSVYEPSDLGEAADAFPVGRALRVALPDSGGLLFEGDITAVEVACGPARESELRVRAYDRLHRLRKRQPQRVHTEVTLADLAAELVREDGIDVECEVESPLWRHVFQHRQSDFDLLDERARLCGAYFVLDGDRLRILTLDGHADEHTLELGENLFEAKVEVNAETTCRRVSTLGWDPMTATFLRETVDAPRVGTSIDVALAPGDVGGTGERTIVDVPVADAAQAVARAQAELDRRAAHESRFSGVTDGDVTLRAGDVVEVSGLGRRSSGRFVLGDVRHAIDGTRGFVTEISTDLPSPPPRVSPTASSGAACATIAVVTSVDDPEELGRVKVRLPSHGDLETSWLEVMAPGAGDEKGLVVLPDVDDNVVVMFADHDPAFAIVLGGIYGHRGTIDGGGVVNGSVRRFTLRTPGGHEIQLDDEVEEIRIRTPGGHRLAFDDANESIELETPAGHRVSLDDRAESVEIETSTGHSFALAPDLVSLRAEGDIDIAAPGKGIRLRADHIDFEHAPSEPKPEPEPSEESDSGDTERTGRDDADGDAN